MRCASRRLWIGDDGAGIAVWYICEEFMFTFLRAYLPLRAGLT